MKLILTHEVANLGAPGDVVEVKDGYGRNYLLPRGLAIVATRGAQRQADDTWRDPDAWSAACIRNIAGMTWFSADRAITEYARTVWHAQI